MHPKLKSSLVLFGVLCTSDLIQGVVMYSLGKSDGTIPDLFKNIRIPSGQELFNLCTVAVATSLVVGYTTEKLKKRWNLDECYDLRQSLLELTEAIEESV